MLRDSILRLHIVGYSPKYIVKFEIFYLKSAEFAVQICVPNYYEIWRLGKKVMAKVITANYLLTQIFISMYKYAQKYSVAVYVLLCTRISIEIIRGRLIFHRFLGGGGGGKGFKILFVSLLSARDLVEKSCINLLHVFCFKERKIYILWDTILRQQVVFVLKDSYCS